MTYTRNLHNTHNIRRQSPTLSAVLLLALSVSACSAAEADKTPPYIDGFQGIQGSLLRQTGFTGSVIKPQQRFAGYVAAASRLSLIDPATEDEAWGAQIDGSYQRVVPLPDYSGATLFTRRGIRIVISDADQIFADAAFEVGGLAVAAEAVAYAQVSQDGKQLRLLRRLSSGAWQDETWGLPWQADPLAAAPASGGAPLAVVLLAPDGNRLLVVRPFDGRYALYTAADREVPVAGPVADCPGDGVGTVEEGSFRSVAWDGKTNSVYLGDRSGRLFALTPVTSTAACEALSALPQLDLSGEDDLPITGVSVLAAGKVGVSQAGGRVHTVDVTAGAFGEPETYTDLCDYPLGLTAQASDGVQRLLVGCFRLVQESSAMTPYPASVPYDQVSLQVLSVTERRPELEIVLPRSASDGAGAGALTLDPARSQLVELRDSALGIVRITSLVDGGIRERKGIFLKDLLQP